MGRIVKNIIRIIAFFIIAIPIYLVCDLSYMSPIYDSGIMATILSIITTEVIFSAFIFYFFPGINFQMGQTQLPLPAFIAINFEYVLCGFILYSITQLCKKFRLKQSFNKKAFIFMLFPLSQLFLLSAILKILIMSYIIFLVK